MWHVLYRLTSWALVPLLPAFLEKRARRGKEDRTRMRERYGHANVSRPEGNLLWFHAASVGEMHTALPLITALGERLPHAHFLITTVTVTSAQLIADKLPPRTQHQFAPVDTPPAIRRFLDHWKPYAAFFLESELWPNMVLETKRTGAALFIINGRMSQRSFTTWSRLSSLSRRLIKAFNVIFAQSRTDAERFTALGATNVQYQGNLKYDTPPLPCDENSLHELQARIGNRPVWLAASTHPGEEALVHEAHQILSMSLPDLLTIIVPRHAARGADIEALLALPSSAALRSHGDIITPTTAFYIADTMGELGLFYRLCPVVFMGGSLVPHGGQNLIEPAALGCSAIVGPHHWNFTEVVEEFRTAQALLEVQDAAGLADAVQSCLTDNAKRDALAQAALQCATRYRGLTAQLADTLLTMLS